MEESKGEPDLSDVNVFQLTDNIFQSEGELKIQKQNRIRNIIRNRQQEERRRSSQADDRDSGIFDTGRFDNLGQFNKEADEKESKDTSKIKDVSEIKGQYFDTPQGKIHEAKPLENNPELQLEQQDRIIEDLDDLEELIQCHLALANGAEVDDKQTSNNLKDSRDEDSVIHSDTVILDTKNKQETDLDNQFNSLLEELIKNLNHNEKVIPNQNEIWKQSTPERRSETEIKFSICRDHSIKTNQEDKRTSINSCYSQDASTQTEKIKKLKRCQIM